MDKGTKGAHNELIAAAWLLKNGYAVFRNVSAHGPVDLIAMKDAQITLIDVKAAISYKGKMLAPYLTEKQITMGVKAMAVFPDGSCELDTGLIATQRRTGTKHNCKQCAVTFESKRRTLFCTSVCKSSYHNAKIRAKRATTGP